MMIAGITDIGLVRHVNEDSICVDFQIEDYRICMLADGMGGHSAGEIASTMAIEYVKEYMNRNSIEAKKSIEEITLLGRKAILYANERVYKKSIMNSEYLGMGTTFTMACLLKDTLILHHLGDSRAYLLRKENLNQLTADHTLVAELIKIGSISREEALVHPQKNVITRALGTSYSVEIDTENYEIEKEDCLLLCSDGLTNMISNEVIKYILSQNIEPEIICKNLIEQSKANGGYDNISAIVVKL